MCLIIEKKCDALLGNQYPRYFFISESRSEILSSFISSIVLLLIMHNITLTFLEMHTHRHTHTHLTVNEKSLNLYYMDCWEALFMHFMKNLSFSSAEVFHVFNNIRFILFFFPSKIFACWWRQPYILFQDVPLGLMSAKKQTKKLKALILPLKH